VTQHGSFPGRPRGRRARHQSDVPEGEGYPASPDEREFPDLSPIRPRDSRLRDARGQGDWPGQPARPGQYGQPDLYGQQGDGSGGYGGGYPAAGGGFGQSGQAPWTDQEWPAQQPAGQPAVQAGFGAAQPPQARHAQPQQAPAEQAAPQWTAAQSAQSAKSAKSAKQEEDVPSWAEPDSVEAFSARWHRRGLDSRDDRRSDRRNRRRLLIAGGGVVAVVIAVAVYFLTSGGGGNSANLGLGSLVTQFLPGEVQTVPDACSTVSTATLSQYLPDSPKQAAPPLNSGTDSQCSWTMDDAPTYRVLEVQVEAYTPSALVANSNGTGLVPEGNGSATYAAEAAFASYDYNLVHPAAKSGQPAATVAEISGMPGGTESSAFSATQVLSRGGAIFDEASVYVRYRNVVIIALMEGLDHGSGAKKNYGPVAMSDLATAAKTVAKQVAGQIVR
jgi:hypothetical protein